MKKYRNYIISLFIIVTVLISICFVPIDATKLIPVIEKQIYNDLGIKIHIEKLILRLGPSLKAKSPIMHMMYEDGQKFGQFDNVKFYIPWKSIITNDATIKKIYANNLILKINSEDKYLNDFFEKLSSRDYNDNPNIILKKFNINYSEKAYSKHYALVGSSLEISKIKAYKNYKLSCIGDFLINDKKYISYDLSLQPNVELKNSNEINFDFRDFIDQIETLDFHSDIMADLKIYNNSGDDYLASGLINIDNISVLDPAKKNPKSFVYLTFLGNKIGVFSNFYTSVDKKIYVEGAVNHSQKPDLDLKVKTDDINLAEVFPKIKLLLNCSKFKGIESLKGNLSADFALKGDLNKIKSNSYLKISDASIKARGIDVNRINTDIDFSNNVISISDAIGYVKDAPVILKGKIDKTLDLELLMSKVELKHISPEYLGVKNGILSLSANIGGTLRDITHKENILVENFASSKDNNTIEIASLKMDTNKESIAYINNFTIKPSFTEVIKIPSLKFLIESDVIKMPETKIFMQNSSFTAKADISNFNSSEYSFNMNIDGNLSSRDINILKNYSYSYPVKLNFNGNKNVQNIESQVQLENTAILDEPSVINFASKFENNVLKIEDLSISSFTGKLSNNFKANLKGSKKAIITGSVEDVQKPVFKNVRIFIPQPLNITLGDTIAQLKGDVFINGKVDDPEIVGQFTVQNLIDKVLQLSVNAMTLDFNKNVLVLNAPLVKLSDSSVSLNSTISTNITNGVNVKNLSLKSKYINTDTILMYKDALISKLLPINVNDGKLYAERVSLSLYGAPIQLSALSADLKLKDNLLSLKNIASEMSNGKLAGSLDFNLIDENFDTKIQARGVSASPIFDVIAIKKDTVSGTMDFDTALKGNLSSKQTLDGDIRFIVHNGRLGTLGKLEHLLYAQNVVADSMLRTSLSVVTKAITLKDTGLFKYLRGDIKMTDGVANIKMLQSQGPLMALYVKGQYYPANDTAKLVVLGRISDEVVTGLGAFGEFSLNKLMIMLTGEENRYNIKPEDIDMLPQLPMKNTKEFRSVINGMIEKPSSVMLFNWISYSQKSYRQKEVPMGDVKVPDFIENLPY